MRKILSSPRFQKPVVVWRECFPTYWITMTWSQCSDRSCFVCGRQRNSWGVISFVSCTILVGLILGVTHHVWCVSIFKVDILFFKITVLPWHFLFNLFPDSRLLSIYIFVFIIFVERTEGNTLSKYGWRCYERLKAKTEGSKRLTHTGLSGGKEGREVWEWDGNSY